MAAVEHRTSNDVPVGSITVPSGSSSGAVKVPVNRVRKQVNPFTEQDVVGLATLLLPSLVPQHADQQASGSRPSSSSSSSWERWRVGTPEVLPQRRPGKIARCAQW